LKQLVEVTDLKKAYQTGEVTFEALKGVSLKLAKGDFVTVMGHSGSGKSTLLHLIGGLDRPTAGSVKVDGHLLNDMNETALAKFRRTYIGFVFQFFNLVDNLTIQANVELPALLAGRKSKKAIRKTCDQLLQGMGIADQAHKHPWELSGGQQQRAAIARALINEPPLLLADEPTGNLDSSSSQDVLEVMDKCHQWGQTILLVTHDPLAAARAEGVLFLHDGRFVGSMPGGDAKAIAQRLTELR
jgi:putative ABC transport system ATP-binding protein